MSVRIFINRENRPHLYNATDKNGRLPPAENVTERRQKGAVFNLTAVWQMTQKDRRDAKALSVFLRFRFLCTEKAVKNTAKNKSVDLKTLCFWQPMSAVFPFGVTSVWIEADRCMDINYKNSGDCRSTGIGRRKTLKKQPASATMLFPKWTETKTSRLKPWENLQSPELYSQRHYGICVRQQIKKQIMNGTPHFVNSYSEAVCRKK